DVQVAGQRINRGGAVRNTGRSRHQRKIEHAHRRACQQAARLKLADVIAEALRRVVGAREQHGFQAVKGAGRPLLQDGTRPARKGRFQPLVGGGRRRIGVPRQMAEGSSAGQQQLQRHVGPDKAQPTLAQPRQGVLQDLFVRLLQHGFVHFASHWGRPSASTGKITSSTRCTRSAARNGSTPLKTRVRGTSGATPWMTNRFMPMGGCTKPISIARTRKMPNQIGDRPISITSGNRMGVVSNIRASPSSTDPTTSRNSATSSMVATWPKPRSLMAPPMASVSPVTLMKAANTNAPMITR